MITILRKLVICLETPLENLTYCKIYILLVRLFIRIKFFSEKENKNAARGKNKTFWDMIVSNLCLLNLIYISDVLNHTLEYCNHYKNPVYHFQNNESGTIANLLCISLNRPTTYYQYYFVNLK